MNLAPIGVLCCPAYSLIVGCPPWGEYVAPLGSGMPPPSLRSLKLDGCAIGDDGLEVIADACERGLEIEELFIERCEITNVGIPKMF